MLLFLSFLYFFGGLPSASNAAVDVYAMTNHVTIVPYSQTSRTLAVKGLEMRQVNTNPDSLTYVAAKAQVDFIRIRLRNDFKENRIDIDSVKRTFGKHLTDQIIPYWYGTGWSFSGHTAVPKKGKIACGYFISTTLKDMGLNLNRYKLAQKSPLDEAKALSCGTEIITIAHEDPNQALAEIKGYIHQGVYFIGFDTGHVGFLVKKKEQLLLVHSNYLAPVSVCVEPLETARVFKTFKKFHLVDISNNERLIQKWLNNDVVLR
ncbi:hypothetical protein [uncultured Kriegella sp.]|uniref:hypothetical protein n=1 Tax=uncultured Kriegella sp. TaxID=1798910 RepID=UPI0030DCEF45|tara:strand:+ start:322958 stop:323743 length:786 start_codon:yes stop_codon:yes gene_type:complete